MNKLRQMNLKNKKQITKKLHWLNQKLKYIHTHLTFIQTIQYVTGQYSLNCILLRGGA